MKAKSATVKFAALTAEEINIVSGGSAFPGATSVTIVGNTTVVTYPGGRTVTYPYIVFGGGGT